MQDADDSPSFAFCRLLLGKNRRQTRHSCWRQCNCLSPRKCCRVLCFLPSAPAVDISASCSLYTAVVTCLGTATSPASLSLALRATTSGADGCALKYAPLTRFVQGRKHGRSSKGAFAQLLFCFSSSAPTAPGAAASRVISQRHHPSSGVRGASSVPSGNRVNSSSSSSSCVLLFSFSYELSIYTLRRRIVLLITIISFR